jgi:predicted acyltransferase
MTRGTRRCALGRLTRSCRRNTLILVQDPFTIDDAPRSRLPSGLASPQQRIKSLDALRGLAVVVWLIGAFAVPALNRLPRSRLRDDITAEFSPSFWHGVTIYDLALPTFLFATGAAIVPSFGRRQALGQTGRQLGWRIARRVVLLFAIGLLCGGGLLGPWSDLRYVGAFQRIAACYAVAACLYLATGWRFQAGLVGFLLIDYWAILAFGTGGDSSGVYSADGSLAAYLDNWILPGRKYFGTWDPNGILTTIPAIAVTVAGLLTGRALATETHWPRALSRRLLVCGIAAINVGFLSDFICPINSHLWTTPFCLIAIGTALLALVVLNAVLVIRQGSALTKLLTACGANALFVILGSATLSRHVSSAASVTVTVAVLFGISMLALWFERRKVYMNV